MRRGYADTDVGQIHFREAGTGDAVLLLHQTPSSSVMYERCLPLLAKEYRAVAVDTPGFGLSDPPASPPSDMGHYARAAVGVLDHLGIEQASVVAVRTGASIAVELATAFPERVDKLVLTGLVALATEEELQERRANPVRGAMTWEPDGRGEFVTTHVMTWVHTFARDDDGEQYLRELTAQLQAGPNYSWAYKAVIAYDAWQRLPRITQPTLFLNPLGDPGYENAKRHYPRVPRSKYVEMPGEESRAPGWAGAPAAYPHEYAGAVMDFLRDPGV